MATRSRMKLGYSTLALTLGQRWVVDSSTEGLRRVAHLALYLYHDHFTLCNELNVCCLNLHACALLHCNAPLVFLVYSCATVAANM